jgi:sulfatase modifying factor 1
MTRARVFLAVICLSAYVLTGNGAGAQQSFRDCADCPEMVIVPPGSFVMGQPESESQDRRFGWGGPPVNVTIAHSFAIGRTEVTRAQFKAFLDATGYEMTAPCNTVWRALVQDEYGEDAAPTWQNPLYPGGTMPEDNHPMVCIGFPDAQAYVAWLNTKAPGGRRYHLPSEAQWEYAARAGTTTVRPWGGALEESCTYANIGDSEYGKAVGSETIACTDGYAFTSPVGSFPPNAFGLYDTMGNVWEWTQDCWVDDHTGATLTAKPVSEDTHGNAGGDCTKRVMRGGGFSSEEWYVRVTTRGADPVPRTRLVLLGLRVAADLAP